MSTFTDKLVIFFAVVLLLLSVAVSVPLAIATWQESGGPWGFGIIGLPVLLPLSAYLLFGIAGLQRQPARQREFFIGAQIITLVIGMIGYYIFPVLPVAAILLPVLLSTIGIISKRYFKLFLLLMMLLAIIGNLLLLKWELDFGRTVPLLQLFIGANHPDP